VTAPRVSRVSRVSMISRVSRVSQFSRVTSVNMPCFTNPIMPWCATKPVCICV
jgi:hypothetical protein